MWAGWCGAREAVAPQEPAAVDAAADTGLPAGEGPGEVRDSNGGEHGRFQEVGGGRDTGCEAAEEPVPVSEASWAMHASHATSPLPAAKAAGRDAI